MLQRCGAEDDKGKAIDVWAEVLRGAMPGVGRSPQKDETLKGHEPEAGESVPGNLCMWGRKLRAAAHARLMAGARDARARVLRWGLSAEAHKTRAAPLSPTDGLRQGGWGGGVGRREVREETE